MLSSIQLDFYFSLTVVTEERWYKKLFSDVRNFEAFKYLHIGCISDLKRKSLPEIAKIAGLDNYQGLHHFLTAPSWEVEQLRALDRGLNNL